MSAPYSDKATATQQGEKMASSPAASSTSEADARHPGLVAGIQQRQAEYTRLLELCRSLRAHPHRCPGRCVLTGELGQGGLSAFRSMLDGSA